MQLSIIPAPSSVRPLRGQFVLESSCKASAPVRAWKTVDLCLQQLRDATGHDFPLIDDSNVSVIDFVLDENGSNPESYHLRVTPGGVTIQSSGEPGLFYGFQTFRQLLPATAFSTCPSDIASASCWEIPCVEIEDIPRFVWRGALLDVGRHFMPKEFVKKFVDIIAQHKMNIFHWHLTEDQGWRIEIKRYPKLTEVGAWRSKTLVGHAGGSPEQWKFDDTPHGGFYTQEDVREVVAYAAARHVTVMPEIEMPGHAQAAIAAYPELGNDVSEPLPVHTAWGVNPNVFNVKDSTIEFLKNVLDEVLDLFPSRFIHIGGDECEKIQWRSNRDAQHRIKSCNLQGVNALQSWFIRQIDEFLTMRGRRLVGWDEILEGGLAENATVMSWRGISGGIAAAQMGHDVVMAPTSNTYFDYYQTAEIFREPLAIGGQLPLENVYGFEPIPPDFSPEQKAHVLGTQCQLWTEYMKTPADVERMAFPRLCALAEVAWSAPECKSFADFQRRLIDRHLQRLKVQQVNFWQPTHAVDEHGNIGATTDVYYVAQHLGSGHIVGTAFQDLPSANTYFSESLCLHFSGILMNHEGNALKYHGREDVRSKFRVWLKKRQQLKQQGQGSKGNSEANF